MATVLEPFQHLHRRVDIGSEKRSDLTGLKRPALESLQQPPGVRRDEPGAGQRLALDTHLPCRARLDPDTTAVVQSMMAPTQLDDPIRVVDAAVGSVVKMMEVQKRPVGAPGDGADIAAPRPDLALHRRGTEPPVALPLLSWRRVLMMSA